MSFPGYSGRVWELFTTTPRAGAWPEAEPDVVKGQAATPASRAVLSLQLKHDGGRIVDARFRAFGCPTTIAVGAWLAQWAVGRNLADLAALDVRTLREALEIPEERAHCAFLGEDAVKSVLQQGHADVGSTY